MEYTQAQAAEALRARVNGEFDNKELMKLGALSTSAKEDCARIISYTERAASTMSPKEHIPAASKMMLNQPAFAISVERASGCNHTNNQPKAL